MIKIIRINNSNVLTKNYKWVKKEIGFLFFCFNCLVNISIPYWISPSNLSPETLDQIKEFYKQTRKEQ